ncbi:MAG: phosphate signaling complex protein PhoU [Planctomycetia bacterium]|nr:phosphate signaling complex protein PhoU [Planctomycetia bacterium]
MSKHLHRDLEALEEQLLAMSAKVEEMIAQACAALRDRRGDLAAEVMQADNEVDQQEVLIEEECLKILALHQPVAIDLRRVTAVLKINNDLERIADLATSVAERATRLSMHPAFPIPQELTQMAGLAISMVRDALDAFVRLDVAKARNVCVRDHAVDAIYYHLIDVFFAMMMQDSNVIKAAIHCDAAARSLERIADHATNIAEDVLYLVEGEIARHKHLPQQPK